MACPICAHEAVRSAFRGQPQYVQCADCGFLWRTDREEIARWNRIYDEREFAEEQARQDPQRAEYHRRRLSMIHRHVRPPGRFLEIGCGTGELLRLAVEAGWEASGIEPSGTLCHIAGRKIGAQHVTCSTVGEMDPANEHYDCVAAIDVLEHVVHPSELVSKAQQWLRPGGFLALQTPNARSLRRFLQGSHWNLLVPDQHVVFHTRTSLLRLLAAHQFEPVEVFTVSGRGTDRGLLRVTTRVYEKILSLAALGNALWVVARRG